ncbi:MAG TPA: extracellular solute-binding protein [Geminicoccus sp.]|uniref:ABC transporter substrate-binding protein n=1 Tax=Geminicoccus sp. TaxID=2024832 RepID=UPI002E32E092|nr:extracellular solute-binding protein [Geminicoccus sp.]HEX2525115.1 extracellular solute-binding protein [Geminicoccus sp.]
MNRRLAVMMSGVAATALLALSPAFAQSKTEIRVIVAHYSDHTMGIFQGMESDFEAAHPDVDIKLEDVSWDNLQQRLTTDIAGGTAPDIAIIGTRWLLDYAANDIAEPIDEYMTPEFKAKFIEAFLEPSVIDGVTYGLPIAASARAMYYNKDLLANAGFNEPPKTWDEVVKAAQAVKDKGEGAYGFGMQGKEIETDIYWYYALWTHGGELVQDGKSGIDSEAGVKAATLYKSMIDQGLTQPSPTGSNRQDMESLFKQGRAAMILSGPWLRGQIKSEAPNLNYALAPIPVGTTQATYGVTDTIMIFKSSEHKDVAWQFLEETAFSDKHRVEFSKKEGFLPVMKAEAADPTFANDEQLQAFTGMLPYAKFAPLIPNWELASDAATAALQRIYQGQAEPQAALTEAAEKINEAIQE